MEGFKFSDMSAAEIIEQIKMLPSDEREQVADYVREHLQSQAPREERLQRAMDKVFTDHHELLHRLAQ